MSEHECLTVEVRLRFDGDGKTWEERPVVTTFDVYQEGEVYVVDLEGDYHITTSQCAQAIARSEGAVESRWNFQGSNQGHYNSTK